MAVEIKFCGLTRAEDANEAVSLGASYVGVIFAGGPRNLSPEGAAKVLAAVPPNVRRVGVFADQSPDEIAKIAKVAGLQVLQLHSTPEAAHIAALRERFDGDIWPVARVAGTVLPQTFAEYIRLGDGVVLDAFVVGELGGTGVALPWANLAADLESYRNGKRIVVAGGLRSENVAQAIAALSPDVVDVSSGVESAPGIKDHNRMRAFRDAVSHASIHT